MWRRVTVMSVQGWKKKQNKTRRSSLIQGVRHGVFKLWESVVCSKLRESKTTDSSSSYACYFHRECNLQWPYHVPDRLWPVESCRFAECHVRALSLLVRHANSLTCFLGRDGEMAPWEVLLETFFPCVCSLMLSQIRLSSRAASLKEKDRKQHWCRFECEHYLSCVFRSVFRRERINENGVKDNCKSERIEKVYISLLFLFKLLLIIINYPM